MNTIVCLRCGDPKTCHVDDRCTGHRCGGKCRSTDARYFRQRQPRQQSRFRAPIEGERREDAA